MSHAAIQWLDSAAGEHGVIAAVVASVAGTVVVTAVVVGVIEEWLGRAVPTNARLPTESSSVRTDVVGIAVAVVVEEEDGTAVSRGY